MKGGSARQTAITKLMSRKNLIRLVIGLVLVLIIAGAAFALLPHRPPGSATGPHPVVHVTDGDTIEVEIDGKIEIVRFLGINTPETVDKRKPVQCFGREASNRMKSMLAGQVVYLENSPGREDRDKYGRLLRYVFLADGTDVNLKMLKGGYAYEYTYGAPYSRQEKYRAAEAAARASRRGLWSPQTCDGRL